MRYILFALLFTQVILGQYSIKFQDPKPPEVFQFEKYGNVPTSKYTGRPDVTIPLYTINYGDINIPLNIQYTSNGIRVDEEASEVGLGWYFGTGMISQIKNGKDDLSLTKAEIPDFLWSQYGSQNVTIPNPEWFWTINPNTRSAYDPLRILLQSTTPSNSLNQYFAARVSSDGAYSGYTSNTLFLLHNNYLTDYGIILNDQRVKSDASLDIFHANFFGQELYFYIDPYQFNLDSPDIHVMNNEKYKIELSRSSKNWKITAPNGISYYFNERKSTQTNSWDYPVSSNGINTNGTGYSVSTSPGSYITYSNLNTSSIWKITAIEDTKGNAVSFRYEPLPIVDIFIEDNGALDLTNAIKSYHYFTGNVNDNTLVVFNPLKGDVKFPNEGAVISKRNFVGSKLTQERSILKEISFGSSHILFNNTDRLDFPGARKIENINIYNTIINNAGTIDVPVKQINFSYDYFTNPALTDVNQKRLKLNSISFGEKPYLFTYNQINLPSKDSNSSDFWGFYNGMPNTSYVNNPFRLLKNTNSISGWTNPLLPLIEGKANKSAHPVFCKAGILEIIEYPTGGSTKFEYELNEFNNYFFPNYDNKIGVSSTLPYTYLADYPQVSSKGFGLRVMQTIDYDNNGNYYKKNYSYSGGKHIPAYTADSGEHNFRSARFYVDYSGHYSSPAELRSGQYISSYSNSFYQSSFLGNGNFVGYDKVTVEEESLNSEHNGKIVSYYTNVPDISSRDVYGSDNSNSTGYPNSNYDLFGQSIRNTDVDNGLLIKEEILDKLSNYKQTNEYEYESIVSPSSSIKYNVSAVKIPGDKRNIFFSYTTYVSDFSDYLFFYYPLKMTHTRLMNKKTTNFFSTGSKWNTTNYFYNFTKDPSGKLITDESGNNFYEEKTITRSAITDPYVKIYNSLDLPQSSYIKKNGTLVESKFFYYHLNGSLLKQVDVLPKGIADSDNKASYFYDFYGSKGNLVQFHKENGIYTTIIWGYNETQPIAKIENATYAEVTSQVANLQTLSDIGAEANLILALTSLRNSLPNSMVTTYTYKPLIGLSTITDPKGETIYYNYDSFGRLQNVKDKDGNILSENEYHYKN